jgi:ABC-2 type transport system ATP-binding protein
MAKKTYAIEAKNIHKSFGKVKVLEGIDLKVERGTVVALLGPNGAGKTTTVKILTTLLNPDSGTACVEGFDVTKRADDVRSIIGLTGQYAAVDEFLTGRENLRMMGDLYHLRRSDTKKRTEELLEQFGLMEAANRAAKTYSGGMRRRLDLAASLIATPPVIFLDEPTTGLDPRSRLSMWDNIQALVKGGATILLTTQYLEEADQLADRIVVIDGGKVIAEGTSDQLKDKVGKERVELVLGSAEDVVKVEKLVDADKLQVNLDTNTVSIANEGGAYEMKGLLEKLQARKVVIESLSLHKPTLDDVFLKLTGHQATEAEAEEDAAASKKGKK